MRHWCLFAVVIFIFGFALRLKGIHYGLPSKNLALTTYHPDEALSYQTLAEITQKGFFQYTPGREFYWGSLHLYTLGACLKLSTALGYIANQPRAYYEEHLAEADRLYIVGRLLSILSGSLTILVLYFTVYPSFGYRAAFLAALFLALAPVHASNSWYVRPDILMLLFAILSLALSLRYLATTQKKYFLWACAMVGFSTATKYSGGAYVVVPLTAYFLTHTHDFTVNLEGMFKDVSLAVLVMIGTFLIGCPHSILSFSVFTDRMVGNIEMATIQKHFQVEPGWLRYLKQLLPMGVGRGVYGAGILGIPVLLYYKQKSYLCVFISGILVFLITSWPIAQAAVYTLPSVVFLCIFAAVFFDFFLSLKKVKWLAFIILAGTVFYTFIYSMAYLGLFYEKNVREEASEWIEANIPKGETVGIARSFFWTPPILRQYHPPYRLLMGGDIHSKPSDFILGLKNVTRKAKYLILSEYEYQTFIKHKDVFPEEYQLLKTIMEEQYQPIQVFEKKAKFFDFTFIENSPPGDWIFPNPKIIVFKKL